MTTSEKVLWSRFGSEMRRIRRLKGVAQQQLAQSLHLSTAMVSAIERGTRAPKREHAEGMDAAMKTGGALVRLWVSLLNQDSYPDWFQEVVEWERAATEIREYHDSLIPGLLQTEDYARAILTDGRPWDTPKSVEELVAARMERQKLLDRPRGPMLWFVVNETTLRAVVRGEFVMRAQLGRVAELVEARTIGVQVIRSTARAHPSRSGEFRVMGFADRPMIVCVGHKFGELVIDAPDRVRQASTLFGALQGEALSPGESLRLIRDIHGAFDD